MVTPGFSVQETIGYGEMMVDYEPGPHRCSPLHQV